MPSEQTPHAPVSPALEARPTVIGIYNVEKTYRVYGSALAKLKGHLLDAMPKPFGFLRRFADWMLEDLGKEFRALKKISLEIRRGESVAIIGRNGSGKSTLLQIIAGTRPPTAGRVSVKGRIAAILELGSGFKPDFTGRENVIVNGLILGLSRAEIQKKFPAIEAFADIGEFIDQPVKKYSSGMLVRLVFAVQVALEPEILIVDEALAVGDVFFQQKCSRRMQELKDAGTTLLFVSHNMTAVRNLCEKVVYLRQGNLEFFGPTELGLAKYFSAQQAEAEVRAEPHAAADPGTSLSAEAVAGFSRLWAGSGNPGARAAIRAVLLDTHSGAGSLEVQVGDTVRLRPVLQSLVASPVEMHLALVIRNSFDQLVCSVGTHGAGGAPFELQPGVDLAVDVELCADLEPGQYTFRLSCGMPDENGVWQREHATDTLGPLLVSWVQKTVPRPFDGPFGLPVKFQPVVVVPSGECG